MTDPTAAPTGEADHWPAFDLTPKAFEAAVADIARAMDLTIVDWDVQHLEELEAYDGSYAIDVTARFQLAGMDFVILFECKRHKDPVKRSDVQVLLTKLQSTGAHKGVMVAATGFQSGALKFAEAHGIACVRLVDDAWTYLTRHTTEPGAGPALAGKYTSYVMTPDDDDYDFAPLTDNRRNARAALLPKS